MTIGIKTTGNKKILLAVVLGFAAGLFFVFQFKQTRFASIKTATALLSSKRFQKESCPTIFPVKTNEVTTVISGVSKNNLQEQDLLKLPLKVLKDAYDKKREELDHNQIETRYERPKEGKAEKEQREYLFRIFKDGDFGEAYWLAYSTLKSKNREIPVAFILSFYNGGMNVDFKDFVKLNNPDDLCWHMGTYYLSLNGEWDGMSACLGHMAKKDGGYFITQNVYSKKIDEFLTYAVELPLTIDRGDGRFEALTAEMQWIEMPSLQWKLIGQEEDNRLEKEFRKSD